MANKSVFGSAKSGRLTPAANAVNEAGGRAYSFSAKHALAQYAATGTFNDSFYSKAEDQADKVLELCAELDPTYIAKVAVYAREKGFMKDMPALLCAHLANRSAGGLALLRRVFPRVVDNGKMLRNFVQIIRSGKTGRKSLGSGPKKLVQNWFAARSEDDIFWQSVGNDPSMADVIKLSRPKPTTDTRNALYGYLIGAKEVKEDKLPPLVQQFEGFKKARASGEVTNIALPKVPMEMLTGIQLSDMDWEVIARNASWTQTRMNLNTFNRHGVFKSKEMVGLVADRLRNKELIAKAKMFPYQLLAAYLNTEEIPVEIKNALQDAMEVAVENVPIVSGRVVVCPDVSGSMSSAITGNREGSTSKVRCIDIAALVASVFMRKNETTLVLPFENDVKKVVLNPRDSVMTNAKKLGSIGGGGTNCSAPLRYLNSGKVIGVDLVVFVSDNESWVDSSSTREYGKGTGTLAEWNELVKKNPKAKLVCIDIQANATTQAQERSDILNIGGFSDSVFEVISKFVGGEKNLSPEHWVGVIEAIEL